MMKEKEDKGRETRRREGGGTHSVFHIVRQKKGGKNAKVSTAGRGAAGH